MNNLQANLMVVTGLDIDVAIAHITFEDETYKFTQAGTDLANLKAVLELELFNMVECDLMPTLSASMYSIKYQDVQFTYGLEAIKEAIVDYYKSTLEAEMEAQSEELQNPESDETSYYIECMIDGLKHDNNAVTNLTRFMERYGITGLDTDDILDDIDDFVTYRVKSNPFIVANQLTSWNYGEMDFMLSDGFYPANILPALKLDDYYTILDMTSYWLIAVLDVEKFKDYIVQQRGTGYVTQEEIDIYVNRLETVEDPEFLDMYIEFLKSLK